MRTPKFISLTQFGSTGKQQFEAVQIELKVQLMCNFDIWAININTINRPVIFCFLMLIGTYSVYIFRFGIWFGIWLVCAQYTKMTIKYNHDWKCLIRFFLSGLCAVYEKIWHMTCYSFFAIPPIYVIPEATKNEYFDTQTVLNQDTFLWQACIVNMHFRHQQKESPRGA